MVSESKLSSNVSQPTACPVRDGPRAVLQIGDILRLLPQAGNSNVCAFVIAGLKAHERSRAFSGHLQSACSS